VAPAEAVGIAAAEAVVDAGGVTTGGGAGAVNLKFTNTTCASSFATTFSTTLAALGGILHLR
jgi:hypothetical protein